MADKYISVQAMRKRLGIDPEGDCNKCQYGGGIGACMKPVYVEYICDELDKEPPADVRTVVRGEFVGKEKVTMCYTRECSNCHGQTPTSGTFCSVCGADMRQEVKDG